ncbi:L-dopachrome tautomerase-related protein [Parabacteroides sp. Marseille-P3160]|uniref:L-dopachrome tautomerase-related protein n=1 Tax=Parabacteroides sp. Marseille-P3160 TaxID=1917887 RepID=UPI000B410AAF|nr:L-dopachrome tautomerase-related protein [Parabacteroides sp. Marseille-P3160]
MKSITTILLFIVGLQSHSLAQNTYHSDKLVPVVTFGEYRAIGVGVSSDNRLFVSFPRRGGAYKYGLVEVVNGELKPYPDETWNRDGDETNHFASVQDLFVDVNDFLWVLDSKPSPGGSIFGDSREKAQEGDFKLLKINLKTNRVDRVYTFEGLDKTRSGLNDIRVDPEKGLAYLSDPGLAALVVLDLNTGKTRTALEKSSFTLADPDIILSYNGTEMKDQSGKPFSSNVNGIALTKDFKYLYFKPINKNNLYRIETKYLADASLTDETLETKVEDMGEVGVTHGLEADRKGNIFLTTSLDYSIKYLSPDGKLHTLVQDSRLLWPDSFGIGTDGYLYFSCAQLQNEPQWNNGANKSRLPFTLYKVKLP